MSNSSESTYRNLTAFNAAQVKEIDSRVDFELNEMQLKMTKIGGITNIFGALLVIWVEYGQANPTTLFTWYAILFLLNVINISFSFYFQHCKVTPDKIAGWLRVYHFLIMPPVCITWGMMGVLFVGTDWHHQFYITVLLLAVLISFSFGTMTDFKASVISITGLLLPSIIYHIYLGYDSIQAVGHDVDLHIGFGFCLVILGIFLLTTCYIGYTLIKKSVSLTYINMALNKQLEDMNQHLENRVQERTKELQDSLKLVKHQATHDLLTDLPNQRLLVDYIQEAIDHAYQNKHLFAIACISLNDLEKITDGLGLQAGDTVIKTVAKRFQIFVEQVNAMNPQTVRYTISLARKDVFVMLIEFISDPDKIEEHIEPIFSVLNESISMDKQLIKLTASIGISVYPRDGRDVKSLLMNADAAISPAKKRGGNSFNVYKAELNADVYKKLGIESCLHTALDNHEFKLQYQPFVDLATGSISGGEALIRWNNPTLGFVPPDEFIPLAEANGMIIPIGEWVFRTACQQIKIWRDKGFTSLKIAINLSAKQLHQKNLIEMISTILKDTQVDPEYVEVELTETEAFQSESIPVIKQIKALGFRLSIDDFGVGYSGLSNLKLFDIDKLKIDKSFIRDLIINSDSKAIVSNTITLAKKVNVDVLAEGVETVEQMRFLKENGCNMIQGYYFSRPLDVADFTKLLESGKNYEV